MAAVSNLKNMVLSLTLVCLVCSAVLGCVYAVTAAPIKAAEDAKTTASIARVLPAFEGQPSKESVSVDGVDYTYYRAPGAGYAVISTVVGFGGPLTLMVGIGEDGLVCNTVVLSHSETPVLAPSAPPTPISSTSSRDGTRRRSLFPCARTAGKWMPSLPPLLLPALIPLPSPRLMLSLRN